jgi:hypothetical protein
MTDHLRTLMGIALVVLGSLAVALLMTGAYMMHFRSDCQHDGGTYSVEGQTAWCRY